MTDSYGKFMVIEDLGKRPVRVTPDQINEYFGVVGVWANNKQESVRALVTEMQLLFAPTAIYMILPRDHADVFTQFELVRRPQHPNGALAELFAGYRDNYPKVPGKKTTAFPNEST